MPVHYVGHPLMQIVHDEQQKPLQPLSSKPILALLPGSRLQELKSNLATMLESVRPLAQDYAIIVAQSPTIQREQYEPFLANYPQVFCLQNQTYNILRQASAALVASGTATLETALFGVPQLVCYRGPSLSVWLARRLIKVKYIALANLILDKMAIPELIQNDFNPQSVIAHLTPLLDTRSKEHQQMTNDYQHLHQLLKGTASASELAADIVWQAVPVARP